MKVKLPLWLVGEEYPSFYKILKLAIMLFAVGFIFGYYS